MRSIAEALAPILKSYRLPNFREPLVFLVKHSGADSL